MPPAPPHDARSEARATSTVTPAAPELCGARVGVVIPAYKVAQQIEKVVRGIPAWIERIIVVEDKSPDDTAQRVGSLADPRVTLLRHAHNRGVGGAMKTGLAEALRQNLDIVIKLDGDDQMDPAHLPALVQALVDGRADVVKCNRYGSLRALQQMPLVRKLGNAGLTFLVKAASGYWNVFDPANGYVALRVKLLERLNLGRLPERYYFESGLLVELGIQRAVVLDVPIAARYGDEHSSLNPVRVLLEFPPRLGLGLLRRIAWRYFVHDFSAVSLFLMIGFPALAFGIGYGTWQYVSLARVDKFATAGEVMLAAMPIILGVQLLLQAIVLDIQGNPKVPLLPPIGAERRAS